MEFEVSMSEENTVTVRVERTLTFHFDLQVPGPLTPSVWSELAHPTLREVEDEFGRADIIVDGVASRVFEEHKTESQALARRVWQIHRREQILEQFQPPRTSPNDITDPWNAQRAAREMSKD